MSLETSRPPADWIGTEIPALLTNDGLKLESGELISEGKVLDTLREAVRLLDTGDKIGFCEMMDVEKHERGRME